MLTLSDRVFLNIKNKEPIFFFFYPSVCIWGWGEGYLAFIFLDITTKPDGPTTISNLDNFPNGEC